MNELYYKSCAIGKEHKPTLDVAERVVGIQLSQPIDLSQMTVERASTEALHEYDASYFMNTVHLTGWEPNEDGNPERITVTITRKSTRIPKL